jgi:phage baseplate assembly protein W
MARELSIHPLDLELDTAIGIKLNPSEVKGNTFISSYTTLEQAKTNLLCLVLTNKGERVMHPTFGVGIAKLLFEPMDSALPSKIKERVISKINTWLPYIDVKNIMVNINTDLHLIEIQIDFSLNGNEFDTDSIVIELSLPPA